MIVEADFLTHWKTRALMNALGEGAPRYLIALWSHCQTRKAWEFELKPLMLAGICGFEGEPEKLWQAMLELRWIEPAEEMGWYRVHGWAEINAALVGSWAGGSRTKGATWHPRGYPIMPENRPETAPGSTRGKTPGSAPGGTPALTQGGTDKIREEKRRKEVPPKAPLQGADTLPMPVDFSEHRRGVMVSWIDYRASIRSRIKPASWPRLLEKLAGLNDAQLEACVTESIANGWKGLFPERFMLPPPTCDSGTAPLFGKKKEGAAPALKPIKPADFPWRDLALNMRGDELIGTWEEQDPRTRRELRELWSSLPPQTKAAQWELAGGRENDEG